MTKVKQQVFRKKKATKTHSPQNVERQIESDAVAPPRVVRLQQHIGNQAVQRMLAQAHAEDRFEGEGRTGGADAAPVASSVQRQSQSPATQRPAPAEGTDDTRFAALKALWNTTVVGGLRGAHQALTGLWPKARRSMDRIVPVLGMLRTLVGAYGSKPLAHARLLGLYHVVGWFYRALAPHAGEMLPLSGIRDRLDPDGKVVSSHLDRTKKVL